MNTGERPQKVFVRICPFCPGRPHYVAGVLQCAFCGRLRPWRTSVVKWIECPAAAQEVGQEALDLLFHSDDPRRRILRAAIKRDESGVYKVLDASIEAPPSASNSGANPVDIVVHALTDAGLRASRQVSS